VIDVSLSVLLPVYNGERYVGKTIESILSQSYRDYELLIIDDGSQDRTPAILAHYARRDSRIRLLRHDNAGVGYTLNRGIEEARGHLLAEIGADDLALPGRLQKQVDFLKENPDYVLVGGYLRIIDPDDRPIGLRKYPTGDRELRQRMILYNPFGSPSLMYRRDDALAAHGYTSRFSTSEDYDFLLRLAQRGKVANLPEPLTAYRLHLGSTKSKHTLRQLRDTIRIKRTAYAEYGYRQTPLARAVNVAQEAMALLPGGVAYWLFTKVVIREPSPRS
jgi:glycosyltransferase involved in cell wall biosynthesis